MKRFDIKTLGCKVNQSEAEIISSGLTAGGLISAEGGHADVCIINTCCVTQKAAMQSRQLIRKMIRKYPEARIIVTGCYAQTGASELKRIKGINEIVGHRDKMNIPQILTGHPTSPGEVFPASLASKRTRPVLKIQDGCSSFCSYCIVPFARGPSRSVDPQNVLNRLRQIDQAGFKEVVLSGIHLGIYGKDLDPPTSLYDLLTEIERTSPVKRVRLSSIEPNEISEKIVRLVAGSKSLCPHFHIPLQSGSDSILEKMNRQYSTEQFRSVISMIKEILPEAAIGTDIMVGFPQETEGDFKLSCALIESLPLTYLHVFQYSRRNGTVAASLPGQVEPLVRKERAKRLREIGQKKRFEFYASAVGQTKSVLLQNTLSDDRKTFQGITDNYILAIVHAPGLKENSLVPCRIDSIDEKGRVFAKPL